MLWLVFFVAATVAFGLTRLSVPLSIRLGVLDFPNPRSSHSKPMPRLGGLGLVGAVLFMLAVIVVLQMAGVTSRMLFTRRTLVAVVAALGTAGLGLCDDVYHLRAGMKLLGQMALGSLVVSLGFQVEVVEVGGWAPVALGFAAIPLTLLWLTGFPNVFNFMDGIDGISAMTGTVYFLFIFILAWTAGSPDLAVLAVVLAGSCVGSLPLNFPVARTFMGDTGSLMLGMAVAVCAVQLAQENPRLLVPVLLVFSAYLWDAGFTLVRRLIHGENIFAAHRTHLYQRLIRLGNSHAKITTLYLLLHLILGCMGLVYLHAGEAVRALALGGAGLLLGGFTAGVYALEARSANVPVHTGRENADSPPAATQQR